MISYSFVLFCFFSTSTPKHQALPRFNAKHDCRRYECHTCPHAYAACFVQMTKMHVLFSHSLFFTVLNMWHMGIMFLLYIDHYSEYQEPHITNDEVEDSYISLDKLKWCLVDKRNLLPQCHYGIWGLEH